MVIPECDCKGKISPLKAGRAEQHLNATTRPSIWPPFQAYPALWRMSSRSGLRYCPVRVMSPPDRGHIRCWVDDVVFKWIPLSEIVGYDVK